MLAIGLIDIGQLGALFVVIDEADTVKARHILVAELATILVQHWLIQLALVVE